LTRVDLAGGTRGRDCLDLLVFAFFVRISRESCKISKYHSSWVPPNQPFPLAGPELIPRSPTVIVWRARGTTPASGRSFFAYPFGFSSPPPGQLSAFGRPLLATHLRRLDLGPPLFPCSLREIPQISRTTRCTFSRRAMIQTQQSPNFPHNRETLQPTEAKVECFFSHPECQSLSHPSLALLNALSFRLALIAVSGDSGSPPEVPYVLVSRPRIARFSKGVWEALPHPVLLPPFCLLWPLEPNKRSGFSLCLSTHTRAPLPFLSVAV